MVDYTLPLDELPDPLPIEPLSRPFDVTIAPPGSKSITNRAFLLAALAAGESRIVRPLRSDDTDRMLAALVTLGAGARWEGDDVLVTGVGGRFPGGGTVDLGDGGTPTRFMIAAACLAAEPVVVDGSPRMRERPVAEGVDMLRRLGADIAYVETEGRLPVRVTPSPRFRGGRLEVPTTLSSQFISAVLLVASWLDEGVRIAFTGAPTSPSYVRLTAHVLRDWSIDVRGVDPDAPIPLGREIAVSPRPVEGRRYPVEPDASSAVYWLAAAAVVPGAAVRLPGLRWPSPQPDAAVLAAIGAAGARWEDLGDGVRVEGPPHLGPVQCDAQEMPDGALALAALAATAAGPSALTGLRTLRVKETDRVAALAEELRRIGCTVDAGEDSLAIDPSTRHDRPARIETYHDHRMAMAFAVLGLVRPGISIADPGCVAKSYPGFWADLARLYE